MTPVQKAAEAFLASKWHPGTDSRGDNIKYGFIAGAKWHEQQARELVEALKSIISEANLHLSMYIKSYKQEPYDIGIILQTYIHEACTRIQIAQEALAGYAKLGEGKDE